MRTFQQSFFMGRAFIAIFKNSACQNGIFAICSLRMLLGHYKRKLQYLQTVQNYHKELPRLSGIIRVHSGRTERTSPITSERFSPQSPCRHIFLRMRPQQRRTAGAFLNLGSAHIGGERLLDELLQRLRLLLFRDGAYDGFTHDIAAAVDHIGGGISKDVGSKLSRLTI